MSAPETLTIRGSVLLLQEWHSCLCFKQLFMPPPHSTIQGKMKEKSSSLKRQRGRGKVKQSLEIHS